MESKHTKQIQRTTVGDGDVTNRTGSLSLSLDSSRYCFFGLWYFGRLASVLFSMPFLSHFSCYTLQPWVSYVPSYLCIVRLRAPSRPRCQSTSRALPVIMAKAITPRNPLRRLPIPQYRYGRNTRNLRLPRIRISTRGPDGQIHRRHENNTRGSRGSISSRQEERREAIGQYWHGGGRGGGTRAVFSNLLGGANLHARGEALFR